MLFFFTVFCVWKIRYNANMNWIAASCLMFLSSIFTYLFVRRSSGMKIATPYQNLAMFLIPLGIFIFLARSSGTSLQITGYQFLIITVTAVFFSYLGNVFSLRSIEYSPNPGYSLILSKSYVVFTTIVSLVFFHSPLTIRGAVGILCIVLFSAMVMIGKPKTDQSHVRNIWLPLAVGAFFCWGLLAIVSKYLLDIGVPIYARLIYVMAIVTVLISGEMRFSKSAHTRLSKQQVAVLLAIGVGSASFNYFQQLGYQLAPNIGYVNAINAASIAGVTACSSLIFGDELTTKKFIGVIGVIAGLIILVI